MEEGGEEGMEREGAGAGGGAGAGAGGRGGREVQKRKEVASAPARACIRCLRGGGGHVRERGAEG